MAFAKKITQTEAGISASYWRIVNIQIDAVALIARIVLAGYVSSDIRQAKGRFVDLREFSLTVPQFVALAKSDAIGTTTFDAIASACYGHIASAPRPIPQGALLLPESGDVLIPSTGEIIPAALVLRNEHEMPQWLPSEFADALIA